MVGRLDDYSIILVSTEYWSRNEGTFASMASRSVLHFYRQQTAWPPLLAGQAQGVAEPLVDGDLDGFEVFGGAPVAARQPPWCAPRQCLALPKSSISARRI